ncbi:MULTISPECIES: gamma-glutamylcyclotransferase family protein [unclassified Vibrio]|uniref:Gamma-glutamylcyclotransferase family protein n=1 Tax=Vibrio sp. HB236076 TaxID=3232307 RepID=A0AB39HCT7_9VIBR|nr:gamma-glutamylcyclotransferase family protein [Vibrio sp. HB161653]MDP5254917.1 gamma-glutamylcyclotransferase family protein [Vibrio sp. HB161653]
MTQYLFGYGSLINQQSRQLTGQVGETYPAVVNNLVRYWGSIDRSYSLSPLVAKLGEGQTNGVLMVIEPQDLALFDQRERGYQRVALDNHHIDSDVPLTDNCQVWVYIQPNSPPPNPQSPIALSYLDTVLSGCLSFSLEFAEHFIAHTQGWQHGWLDDRYAPLYSRNPGISADHLTQIDQLLTEITV